MLNGFPELSDNIGSTRSPQWITGLTPLRCYIENFSGADFVKFGDSVPRVVVVVITL
jgi:hypothetical protein